MTGLLLELMERFPERLTELMGSRQVSARELAKILTARGAEVSHPTVGAWKSGARYPDLAQALELARYFGVSLEYLATGTMVTGDQPLTQDERFYLETGRRIGIERALERVLAIGGPVQPWEVKSVTDLTEQPDPNHKRTHRTRRPAGG